MGRIERQKRLLIEEANKRVLNEQPDTGHPLYNFDSQGIPHYTGGNHLESKPPPEDNYGLFLDYSEDPDGLHLSADLNVGWDTLTTIGKVAVGFLSVLAFGLIKGEVKRIFRKRDIKKIIKEIERKVAQSFGKDALKCFKRGLASVGKIEKLNDENQAYKVRKVIGGCLANAQRNTDACYNDNGVEIKCPPPITVDEFVKELEEIVLLWDTKSKYGKKSLRQRN